MENTMRGKRTLAIAACLVMILGMGLTVVSGAALAHPVSPAAASSGATSLAGAKTSNYPVSGHKGSLVVDDAFGGAVAFSEDPAVDYETIGYEPILNVYQGLLGYNGSSSTGSSLSQFVPVLATCVPGTAQCTADYGTDLVVDNATSGGPQYYTFVIDPAAHFYDPSTQASWSVYPTDVMFSIARDMAWSQQDGVGTTAGWLVAQTLLPNATSNGPFAGESYQATPTDIYSSMLINDSNYCPASAMNGVTGNGCITFNVDGQGALWPQTLFYQVLADGFMSVVSCAWYSHNGDNLTGWDSPDNGSSQDSSCLLPDGQKTTDNSAWTNYVNSLPETYWDNYENEIITIEADDGAEPGAPNAQYTQIGSGPYYSILRPTGSPPGYTLFANPAYEQPSAFSGAHGLATYPDSYSWPAPGGYIPQVTINWDEYSNAAIEGYEQGTIDLGAILPNDTASLLSLQQSGDLSYFDVPTLSSFFSPINLNYSISAWDSDSFTEFGTPNVPADFFSGVAARQLFIHAYDYTTAEEKGETILNVQYQYLAGGPIANGMDYDPTNITYPYEEGNAGTNPAVNGSAAWWWQQGTDPSSPYYDPELAACTKSSPCVLGIVGETGDSGYDVGKDALAASLVNITGGAIQPFLADFNFAEVPPDLIPEQTGALPTDGPLQIYTLGWAADNFDPEDYLIPMAYPNSTYTFSDAVQQQFDIAEYDDVASCGHSAANLTNLIYWAKYGELTNGCEGVAYNVISGGEFYNSTHETNAATRGIMYWAIQTILTNLGLYIWQGQSNQVTSYAPWIEASSINTNPTIGGGGDQLWFQIRYVPYETHVTFTEKGLPSGSTFNVTLADSASPQGVTNSSNGTAATSFFAPNGTISYSFPVVPAGYAISSVTGPKGTTTTGSTVSGSVKGTALTVKFVAVNSLTFTETGLPTGTTWGISLTWSASKGGPPDGNAGDATYYQNTTASSISLNVAGGAWKFAVYVPTNYKVNLPKGSAAVKTTVDTPASKALKFTIVTGTYVFSEKGLKKDTTWGATVTGAVNDTTVCSFSTTKASDTCKLVSGTYDYTVSSVTGYTAAPASGSFTVTAPKGGTEKTTYTAT